MSTDIHSREVFETSDLYLAAFLETQGFQLLEVRREPDSRRCVFVFCDRRDREEMIASYWADVPVRARSFVAACKELKQRVHGVL
jgi:hypothetical protein